MLYNGENCRSANKRTIYHWTRCFGLDFSFLFFVFSSTLFSTTNVPMRIKFTSAKFQSEQILNGYVSFRAKSVWYMLCLFTGCYGIHVSGIVYNFDERQKKKQMLQINLFSDCGTHFITLKNRIYGQRSQTNPLSRAKASWKMSETNCDICHNAVSLVLQYRS